MRSEFLRVARLLLERERRPLSAKELVRLATDERLFSDNIAGKTPIQTMKSKLSVHIRTNGNKSTFVRTRPGRFYLRHLLDEGLPVYDAPPLRPPRPSERVLVFPIRWLERTGRFQGVRPRWKWFLGQLVRSGEHRYMDRLEAEQSDNYKQVLTYILVRNGADLLLYKRGQFSRVEDALRGSLCVGFGGHVSEADRTLFSDNDLGITHCARRELAEELQLPETDRARLEAGTGLRPIGLLNDDSSAVGRRHFAIVYQYDVSTDDYWKKPIRGEKSITQLRWLKSNSMDIPLRDFEYWSQLVLRSFHPQHVQCQPSYLIRRRRELRPPHVLCVLGPVASGKSEATRVLTGEYGYLEVNSGRVLASLLGIPPIPETPRETFQAEAWQFISEPNGSKQLANAIWVEVQKLQSARVLVDGIRQEETLSKFKSFASGRRVGAIFVHTPADMSFEFFASRLKRNAKLEEFLRVRASPVEQESYGMISMADVVLYNWIGQRAYQSTVRRLMGELDVKRNGVK